MIDTLLEEMKNIEFAEWMARQFQRKAAHKRRLEWQEL
jgi:hypothetical protein